MTSSLVDFTRDDGIGLCKHCFYSGAIVYCTKCRRREGKIRGTDIFNGGIFCDGCWEIFQKEREEYRDSRKPILSIKEFSVSTKDEKKKEKEERYILKGTFSEIKAQFIKIQEEIEKRKHS